MAFYNITVPWTALLTLISAYVIAITSYPMMDFLGKYDIDLLPECTVYCYVEVEEDGFTSVYPCKVEKWIDEGRATYYLDSVLLDDTWIDMSEEEIELELEKSVSVPLEDDKYYYSMKMKMCNKKYSEPEGISKTSRLIKQIEDWIMIIFDLLYTFTAVSNIDCGLSY